MNISNLIAAAIVASLLLGNVACACDVAAEEVSAGAHHEHHVSHGSTEKDEAPCEHHNCDNCSSFESSCVSAVYEAVPIDRDARVQPLPKDPDFDSLDLVTAPLETGQPRASPPIRITRFSYEPQRVLLADTPIQRKDQLTE